MAPTPYPIRLDLTLVQNPADLTGADLTNPLLPNQRFSQSRMTPYRALYSNILRGPTRGGNDLMPFKRCNDDRASASLKIVQSLQTLFLEAAKPLTDSQPIRAKCPCNRRNRCALCCQQHHARSPIPPRFTPLLPEYLIQISPLFSRQTYLHNADRDCTITLGALY